ncbi:MAG: preprotein translocase subunit YajC [Deferribacterota bacterium]|nr:preprotein translocase subunit YajC [Deferribacterota bacterium]
MFESIAFAQEATKGGSPWTAFLPLIIIFLIFYFLLIMPQQKRNKKHKQMIESLKVGDEIITTSGIYGRIDSVVDQNTFIVEIAKGVKVKMNKNAVAGLTKQT